MVMIVSYELYHVIKSGDTDKARKLIKAGSWNKGFIVDRKTLLHVACSVGNTIIAELLLESGFPVDVKNHLKQTPLYYACVNENVKIVQFLLEHSASANARDFYNSTPLHVACSNGNAKIVELLLKYNANANLRDDACKMPSYYACENGEAQIVKILLEHGVPVNAIVDKCFEQTGLHVASQHGHSDVVEVFLEHNAKIDIIDGLSYTPLCYACENGYIRSVELLLEHGATIDVPSEEEYLQMRKPLHVAWDNQDIQILNLLIAWGGDIYDSYFDNPHGIMQIMRDYQNGEDADYTDRLYWLARLNQIMRGYTPQELLDNNKVDTFLETILCDDKMKNFHIFYAKYLEAEQKNIKLLQIVGGCHDVDENFSDNDLI